MTGPDFRLNYDRVKQEQGQHAPPEALPEELQLTKIFSEPTVFQMRTIDGERADSAAHVDTLAEAISNGSLLDPVRVWWSGTRWIVIDGHHRLAAYLKAHDKKKHGKVMVPVSAFVGSIDQALMEESRENVKDKLRVSKDDKLTHAWRIVCHDEGQKVSIPKIARACGISERTVSEMRKVKALMLGRGNKEGQGLEEGVYPTDLTWADAVAWRNGEPSRTPKGDEWVERQAREWSKRLAKVFGPKLAVNPSIALRAMEMYSKPMFDRMREEVREELEWEDSPEETRF